MRSRHGKPYSRREIKMLKDLAGKASAEEIGKLLGRSKHSVYQQMKKLKIDCRVRGERHWNAKLDGLQAAMIHTLIDAGYTPTEVFKTLVKGRKVSMDMIKDIAHDKRWRCAA